MPKYDNAPRMVARTAEHVPMPALGSKDFPRDLVEKREFVFRPDEPTCSTGRPRRVASAQAFAGSYLSSFSPYRSLLLHHATGTGKTCAAIQVAELQGAGRRALVLAPLSVHEAFERTVYAPPKSGKAFDASGKQCTGSIYYSSDLDGMSAAAVRRRQRSKVRRAYDIMGHDRFGNIVERIRQRAVRDFERMGSAAVERELRAALVAAFGGRLVIVDEAHELRSEESDKASMTSLRTVLSYCRDCRLVLMTATPMFDRPQEIVALVNLMMLNEGLPELRSEDVFDGNGLSAAGRASLGAALVGRVSYVANQDPGEFPVMLFPSDAGVRGARWRAPTIALDGRPLSPSERLLASTAGYELFASPLSSEQARSYSLPEVRAPRALRVAMQIENVCYDGGSAKANVEAFDAVFRDVRGRSPRVVEYRNPSRRPLHPSNIDKHAPKIGAIVRMVSRARGLCFVYSYFKASGVYACAIALEEAGFVPHGRAPFLADAPAAGKPDAPRYVVITKDESAHTDVNELVDVANDPGSGVKVILGTEIAAQGIDFKRIREVHVLEPWWNMSRIRQVIGRGVRRCSHSDLPPAERNTTVFLHCTSRPGEQETLDQRIYREALRKETGIAQVGALLAEAAIDCGAYPAPRPVSIPPQVTSQGGVVKNPAGRTPHPAPHCTVRWPPNGSRTDESTVHPHLYRIISDLLAFEVADLLSVLRVASFDRIRDELRADEVALAISLTDMMNPIKSWRWLGRARLVKRGGVYVVVPASMALASFTMAEARVGAMFGT